MHTEMRSRMRLIRNYCYLLGIVLLMFDVSLAGTIRYNSIYSYSTSCNCTTDMDESSNNDLGDDTDYAADMNYTEALFGSKKPWFSSLELTLYMDIKYLDTHYEGSHRILARSFTLLCTELPQLPVPAVGGYRSFYDFDSRLTFSDYPLYIEIPQLPVPAVEGYGSLYVYDFGDNFSLTFSGYYLFENDYDIFLYEDDWLHQAHHQGSTTRSDRAEPVNAITMLPEPMGIGLINVVSIRNDTDNTSFEDTDKTFEYCKMDVVKSGYQIQEMIITPEMYT